MRLPAGINKWGVAVLGVVSLLLVVNLVAQYRSMQPGNSRPRRAPAKGAPMRAETGSSHAPDDLAKYDPDLHLDVLKKLDSRPLPDEVGTPFESVGGAPPQASQAPAALPSAPPAPPPPPPLKAVGYNELPGGKKEAMVTYNDDLVVVHEGDLIGTKFKVTKIDPTMVVVEDGDAHKTLELPFPQ
jgi:hypothetical protein